MLKVFLAAVLILFQTSVYTIQIPASGGGTIHLKDYKGKKILVVNIATGSPFVSQLAGLQSLQEQFKDSLVILGFPSNSFSSESKSDGAIRSFCTTTYKTRFLLARKAAVTGSGKQRLYQWLTNETENGALNGEVQSDFQKYLLDEEGNLVGSFSGKVLPLDPMITAAIQTNYK